MIKYELKVIMQCGVLVRIHDECLTVRVLGLLNPRSFKGRVVELVLDYVLKLLSLPEVPYRLEGEISRPYAKVGWVKVHLHW